MNLSNRTGRIVALGLSVSMFCLAGILAEAAEKPADKAEKPAAKPAAKADAPPAAAKSTADKPADDTPDLPASVAHARRPPGIAVHPSLVATVAEAGGRKSLVIRYRWQVYEQASIEVRLIPETHDRKTIVVPVYFYAEHFKGRNREKIFKTLDTAGDVGSTFSFTKDKMVYQVVGERNSLGRPAVHVLCYNEGGEASDRPDCVFLQLDTWAVNDRLLSLDLPHDAFVKPGVLCVWFFRGDKLLWEEKTDWPGYEGKK